MRRPKNSFPGETKPQVLLELNESDLPIALQVAAKHKEKRETILEGFRNIPEAIEKAEHCRERHPDDPTLYDLASQLYLAILDSVAGMIRWMVGDSFCK